MEDIKNLGLLMPAEWGKHDAIWLAWPHDSVSFPNIEKVTNDVATIIEAIHYTEKVELLVKDQEMLDSAKVILEARIVDISRVSFLICNYMNAWMRDCGGIFVQDKDSKKYLVKWIFNSWGNKFPDLDIDALIPEKVAEFVNVELLTPNLVLEGGAIDVNGKGMCLTTKQCLLNDNRNPNVSADDIEKYLRDYLGIQKTIWLERGLANDHTDGHIDEVARFVSTSKIVCAYEDDEADQNFEILKANYELLQKATDSEGNHFEVIKLPMPSMYYSDDKPFEKGIKAPASYTNFYIGNGIVLMPSFNDTNDEKAKEIISSCFPDRKIVQIDCSEIIYGGGGIHCMTQQQPSF